MVIQRKKNTSLLELLESHVEGFILEVAIQTRPSTPFLAHTSPSEPVDKKRKKDKKGKKVSKEGEVVPTKELEPQKGQKSPKGRKGRPWPKVWALKKCLSIALGFRSGTPH